MYNVSPPNYPDTIVDEYFRYTSLRVEGFAGLQVRNGPYGAVSKNQLSDGTVHFCCNKEIPEEEFLNVSKWVSNNGSSLLDKSLASFVDQYWEMRDIVIECLDDENPDDVVPEIKSHLELKRLSGISAVHVGGISEDGKPIFGIELGCTWEDEHGAGTRFLGENLIESGHASEAFNFDAERVNLKMHNETVGHVNKFISRLKTKNIPENIEGVRQQTINLEPVAQAEKVDLISLEQKIEDYLVNLDLESNLVFLRSAIIEDTSYYIWKFNNGYQELYATYSFSPEDIQSYGANDSHGLSPEQFIFADYHGII